MPKFEYDVAIIGSGPGGYVAGIRAAQLGLKAVVIEKEKLGGVCLNIGCIPSKAIIHEASLFRQLSFMESRGIKIDRSGFNYSKVYEASRAAADTLSRGVAYLLKKNNVAVTQGTAKLASQNEIEIDGTKKISAGSIIIATGSRPRQIAGFEFDEQAVLSSTGALMLQKLPRSILILGAGAIGVEFAYIMNTFGVEVHLVEMLDRILPLEDEESTGLLQDIFTKRGIKSYTATKAISMNHGGNGVTVVLESKSAGKMSLTIEKVLAVTGRIPNSENIGLEQLGVKTEKGFIVTGDYGRTSVDAIYAIGDVVPTPLLAHVASKEGEIAVEHIAGHPSHAPRIDLTAIPSAIYCEPQLASFGVTEFEARRQNIDYKISKFPYKGNGKAVAIGETDGLVKIITEKTTGELLGCHIIGANATELIHELLLAKKGELLPQDIAATIHAHPTLSEIVREVAQTAFDGKAIHI